jgi:hypothetical protein
MKDEDASRIASSLERIATGLEQLNEFLQRKTQAASQVYLERSENRGHSPLISTNI